MVLEPNPTWPQLPWTACTVQTPASRPGGPCHRSLLPHGLASRQAPPSPPTGPIPPTRGLYDPLLSFGDQVSMLIPAVGFQLGFLQAGRVPHEAAHDEEPPRLPTLPHRRAPRGQGWSVSPPPMTPSSNSVTNLDFGLSVGSFHVFVRQSWNLLPG